MRWSMNIASLSRTPWDKKGGRRLERFARKLDTAINSMVPWQRPSRWDSMVRRKKLAEQGIEDPSTKRSQKKALELSMMMGQAMKSGAPLPGDPSGKNS